MTSIWHQYHFMCLLGMDFKWKHRVFKTCMNTPSWFGNQLYMGDNFIKFFCLLEWVNSFWKGRGTLKEIYSLKRAYFPFRVLPTSNSDTFCICFHKPFILRMLWRQDVVSKFLEYVSANFSIIDLGMSHSYWFGSGFPGHKPLSRECVYDW